MDKYISCAFAYKLHYIDKIRPLAQPSTLSFGGAVDKAFTAMLTSSDADPEAVFLAEWNFENLSGHETYSKSDLDLELLTDEEQAANPDINNLSRLSLQRKGLLMIKALREKILPNIEHVHSTQEAIELKNQDSSGDTFIGFIDFVASYKGYDKPIIFDLKTSSVPYKTDSVRDSQQLTIYSYAVCDKYESRLAGYVVLSKKIRKNRTKTCTKCSHSVLNNTSKTCNSGEGKNRCGGEWKTTVEFDVDVQVIVDEIPAYTEEKILTMIDSTHQNIRAQNFEQNWDNCIHPKYHSKCPFYELCRSGDTKGLVNTTKDEV